MHEKYENEIGNMIHDTTYHIYVSNENVILSIVNICCDTH